jgi:hypothetical protein
MPGAKPKDTRHIVMSVPHSGTRTLQTWLSEHRPETVPDYMDTPSHWHFNFHPHYISKYFLYADSFEDGRMAYIPVRNPYDVIDRWERRYGDAVDKQIENISQAIGLMVNVVDNHSEHIEIFKMEDMPVIRGMGPNPEGWDKTRTEQSRRLKDLKHWIHRVPEVEAFYRTYYTAEELWWL